MYTKLCTLINFVKNKLKHSNTTVRINCDEQDYSTGYSNNLSTLKFKSSIGHTEVKLSIVYQIRKIELHS